MERLACFDLAFASASGAQTPPLAQLTAAHERLIRSDPQDRRFGVVARFGPDPCIYNFAKGVGSYIWFMSVDLSNIASIELKRGTRFTMQRGRELLYIKYIGPVLGSPEHAGNSDTMLTLDDLLDDVIGGRIPDAHFELAGYPMLEESITTAESNVDYDNILRSLRDVARVCPRRN
jgi:hypothetical protein